MQLTQPPLRSSRQRLIFAINQYLALLAKADPTIWENDVKNETARLSELKNATYDAIMKQRAGEFAKSLAKKSLPEKVQLILDRCYRGEVKLSPPTFHFDMQRLKAFDEIRHDVAHGRGMGIIVSNIDELLLFLWQTLLSLEDVMAARLKLRRGPNRELEKAREIQPRKLIV